MSEKNLKPCPFCGSKDVSISHVYGSLYQGYCDNCTGEGPWRNSRRGAIAAWNRRVKCASTLIGT